MPGDRRSRAAALLAIAIAGGACTAFSRARGEARGAGGGDDALPARVREGGRAARGTVLLGGEEVEVRWSDGDTFRILTGPQRKRTARLAGVNTLERYGPVHRIGAAGGAELYALARESARVAAAVKGRCETDGDVDRYGRLLVSCPEIALALVRQGHAMAYAVGGAATAPELLEAQREAQRARAGMWSGGAPPLVPTSLHSADEPGLGPGDAYDRIADTRTGATEVRRHRRIYAACEEVCVGEGADRACMTYVPYARRYRDRPPCLRGR